MVAIDARWEQAKRLFVGSLLGLAVGLGVAGSLDQTIGGLIVVAAFGLAVVSLHRLGRAGSSGA